MTFWEVFRAELEAIVHAALFTGNVVDSPPDLTPQPPTALLPEN